MHPFMTDSELGNQSVTGKIGQQTTASGRVPAGRGDKKS